ncbi:flavin monoamine oxidase family protein [Roseimaritima sediminicola]|uniref:flavin monoamine oxidase family protein n=1 Tax=Roseimaritima sediminicola TaxID=2662066 RepID=UPI00129839D3|nr:FAD-dependent oxidoreductase [Roseimaritima sediminicola]
MACSRRAWIAATLGTTAGLVPGCAPRDLPPAGTLLSPNVVAGHWIRDGRLDATRSGGRARRAAVVIVGGGIAGLSTAWRLRRAGFDDFILLELESQPGGTSRAGRQGRQAYPWGAHYVPVPMQENAALIHLLEEMQVVVGRRADGQPVVAETQLCRDPQERVFVEGRWQEGLYPALGAADQDLAELERFRQHMDSWAGRHGEDGRRAFAIPLAHSSRDPRFLALDRMTMGDWLRKHAYRSPRLRWLVDYACRDDYGLSVEDTSAWAGLFYFVSRIRLPGQPSQAVITWPEGNGRIVQHLTDRAGPAVHTGWAVHGITQSRSGGAEVRALHTTDRTAAHWQAEQVVYAGPQFAAPHVIDGFDRQRSADFRYGSWIVSNVHLRKRPPEPGFPMCWDNVIYGSRSLGYVNAAHQTGRDHGSTVLSWYYPLASLPGPVARRRMLAADWQDLAALTVTDLQLPHPNIAGQIERLDVMRWGHAMVQPRAGFVWSRQRRAAAQALGRVHFANTDLSGVALMEEAFYHGIRAAEEVLAARGHPFESMLTFVPHDC